MSVKLMFGDCLDLMHTIEPGSVDLIATDLPYGTTQNKWDEIIPLRPLWDQYKRILKDSGACVFTACQPFTSMLVTSNKEWFRFDDVWDKVFTSGYLDAKKRPLRRHESILVFSPKARHTYNPRMTTGRRRKKGKVYGKSTNYGNVKDINPTEYYDQYYPTSIVVFSNANQKSKVHPTQKPEELFDYLISTYSNKGDVVLDNAMGSGTSGVSSLKLERNFIGIENHKPYFDIAEKRILGTAVLNEGDKDYA